MYGVFFKFLLQTFGLLRPIPSNLEVKDPYKRFGKHQPIDKGPQNEKNKDKLHKQ